MGQGIGSHRGLTTGREHEIPRVGVDYFFVTDGGVYTRKELDFPLDAEGEKKLEKSRSEGKVLKCLVVRCHESKNTFGHAIPQKGVDEDKYVVQLVTNDVEWMGYTKLLVKSDNEPSLGALVRQSLEAIR